MALFDDILFSNETIFKNPVALDFDFVPKRIPFRENEQQEIANAIKPLFLRRNGNNVFVLGSPGVGKTLGVKKILSEIEEKTDDILCFYVNCWKANTTYKIIKEISHLINYIYIQNKKANEIFKDIKNILNKKSCVFVFDEIDKLEDQDILYWILEDIYNKSIIMISNYAEWWNFLDSRLKSRLIPLKVVFNRYSLSEVEQILRERLNLAFYPSVFEESAFQKIVQKTYELIDIRVGLFLLREAGYNAENRSSKKVIDEDVDSAIKKIPDFTDQYADQKLTDDEDIKIKDLIKNNPNMKIGDLYKKYIDSGADISYKTFQRKINKLAEANILDLERSMGKGGNTTFVKLNDKNKKINDFVSAKELNKE